MRAAGIDCGTNSLRMLVIESDGDGAPVREVTRELRIVRLGQGVDATGAFAPEALERAFAALEEYAALLRTLQVPPQRIRVVATSAARDAHNREVFLDGVRARIGVTPEVISGDLEAVLSFRGALEGLSAAGVALQGTTMVVDIGGGSTECVLGTPDGAVIAEDSLQVGCVRLRERILRSDPPTGEELSRAAGMVDARLAAGQIEGGGADNWVGVAGTLTSLMAIHLGLSVYDREAVHGASMTREEVIALTDRVASMSAGALGGLITLDPMRASVLGAGALILGRIARQMTAERLHVSESDILDGVAGWALRGVLPAR